MEFSEWDEIRKGHDFHFLLQNHEEDNVKPWDRDGLEIWSPLVVQGIINKSYMRHDSKVIAMFYPNCEWVVDIVICWFSFTHRNLLTMRYVFLLLYQIINASDQFMFSLLSEGCVKLLKVLEHLWFGSLHLRLRLRLIRGLTLKKPMKRFEERKDLKITSYDRWKN